VYEARPDEYDRRYPALAVGDDQPRIDLWIRLDPGTGRIGSTLNGPSVEEVSKTLGLARPPTSGPQGTDVGLQLTDLAARLGDLLDAAKRYILPQRLRTRVQSFPEVSMGASRIALVLATGEVVEDVIVAGDEVVSVGGAEPRGLRLYAAVDVIDRSDTAGAR
jgi:hypothetical protein